MKPRAGHDAKRMRRAQAYSEYFAEALQGGARFGHDLHHVYGIQIQKKLKPF